MLPEGIHDCTLEELEERFAFNPARRILWQRLLEFLEWTRSMKQFSHAYIAGGFITAKPEPSDTDVVLQAQARYGPEAFVAMEPFFARGMGAIHERYSVHLHFWCEGFPGGVSDFRFFFQYLRPQDAAPLGLREDARKGIVRIQL
jgi:hypothetical protein